MTCKRNPCTRYNDDRCCKECLLDRDECEYECAERNEAEPCIDEVKE